MAPTCTHCQWKDEEIVRLRATNAELLEAVREFDKLCTLLKADLERVGKEREALEPNRSERLSADALQLVFEGIVTALASPANDDATTSEGAPVAALDDGVAERTSDASEPEPSTAPHEEASPEGSPTHGEGTTKTPRGTDPNKEKGHGRRPIDLSKLPVQDIVVEPEEVVADPERYVFIGNEVSERLAHRASFVRLRLIRPKYKLLEQPEVEKTDSTGPQKSPEEIEAARTPPTIVCASIPSYLWPRTMADVSAVTEVILAKYDLCLPLHRQERASARCGIRLSRSTTCDWLSTAYDQVYRVVDAMMVEACQTAFCIATDATGAPVRMPGECAHWHMFVFIADADHVIFRPTREHTKAAIRALLPGFDRHLLSDASAVYDSLHREQGVTEVCCWFHFRRYLWKARATEPKRALEALAIVAKLFEVGRHTKEIPMPARTEERARRARPILEILDRWIEQERPRVDDKSPLAAAITYYDNQRDGLRAFLADGRLRLDNNISEEQLRHLVLGRHNWNFFENESGLRWYAVFRSLIASCKLHGLDAKTYLDEVLRLAPHWPTTCMLELAPKYWTATRANLAAEHRDTIVPPWMRTESSVTSAEARSSAA